MNFNIWNTLILAGVIQGFIFGVVVITNRKFRSRANFFLAGLIVTYSLSNLQYVLFDFGYFTRFEFYSTIFLQWALLMPALLLYYGRSLLGMPLSRLWRWIWACPFLISVAMNMGFKIEFNSIEVSGATTDFFDTTLLVSEYLAMVFNSAVLIYLMIATHKHRKQLTFRKDTIVDRLKWFQRTLLLILIATILWAVLESQFEMGSSYDFFYPLWILIAVLIYWLGHLGIYKYGISEQRKKIRKAVYERYSVSEVLQTNEHIATMEQFIKLERNYLDPGLSLEMVASHLNLSAGHLSKVINTELKMSFKDYLNELRIEEAKRYLKDPEFEKYTLAAIGLEAGFNSRSAFNASFKKITGLTPSQFQQQE
ncbi:MAG: helix-turn-helix transcriptional regulator [Bacteroidia bacterium]|nr:helix-turn-helix transcriptional regulator [Bacteroidia bacterium]NNF31650.1 helix-turn-helix transcriptional regulator [Flavobacteriaceae bacterium]MBT8276706.1 helix-turn-helix transcriptional regulator [Bacteroidia bacterium]NNJ83154.1 helix-turn-helix transcriptional regulator [Flavobacteriaceae bacterium]NNK55164.1 helix-turn-helix transcriptional regulator [Flavobacteriaceae bacterium]